MGVLSQRDSTGGQNVSKMRGMIVDFITIQDRERASLPIDFKFLAHHQPIDVLLGICTATNHKAIQRTI